MRGAEGKSAQLISVPIKVPVLCHIPPPSAPAVRQSGAPVPSWRYGHMESPFPACGRGAPRQSLGQKNPGSPWESSPAAAGDTEATGAGAGSRGAMIHILRKGPHLPARQPRSCFVEGKVPSTPQGCRSRWKTWEQKNLGVRLWGRGCRRRGRQALSNKKPNHNYQIAGVQVRNPLQSHDPVHCTKARCNAPAVPASSSPAASLCTRMGRASPKVQQRGRIPTDKVNSPRFLSKRCLHMCRSPHTAGAARTCRSCRPGAAAPWKCRRAPGKRAAASSLAVI